MKNFKRVISVAVCALMMLSMLATCQISFAFAETADGYTYIVDTVTETVTVTKYEGTDAVLSIPNQLGGYNVATIGADAFRNLATVTSITVPSTVKAIGDSAFRNCALLESITINSSSYTLGHAVFADLGKLTVLDLSKATAMGVGILSGCDALAELTIRQVGEANNGAGALALLFDGNATPATPNIPASLKSVIVTNDTSIEDIAFKGADKVETISFSETVSALGVSAFEGCAALKTLDVTINAPIAEKAFYGCVALESVTIDGDKVDKIGASAFEGCVALAEINVGTSLKYINKNALKGTKWLAGKTGLVMLGDVLVTYVGDKTEITLPAEVKYIADSAFEGNDALENLTIPNTVEYIGANVLKNTAVIALTIPFLGATPDGKTDAYIGYLFGGKDSSANSTVLPVCLLQVELTGGEEIAARAFAGCKSLMYVYIPETVTRIGADAFANCPALNKIFYKAINATIDATAFTDTNVDIIELGSKVEVIPTYLCTANANLVLMSIPASVKEIKPRAFAGCYNLKEVTFNAKKCTVVASDAFDYCHKLERIVLTNKVEYIPANLFVKYGSSELEEITIPEGIKEIAAGAFANCVSLKTLNYNATSCVIGDGAFSSCVKLTDIVLGDKVTTIPTNLYTGHVGVTEVVIPAQIERLEDYAFKGCTALENITVPDSLRSIGKNTMLSTLWYENQPDGPVYLGKIFYGYKGTMNETALTLLDGTLAIADSALEGCGALQTLTIPGTVTNIGKDALAMTNAAIVNNSGSKVVEDYATANGITVISTCAHTDVYYVIAQEATATEAGKLDVYCKECGEKFAQQDYLVEEDLLNLWIRKTESTCTVPGVLEMNTGANVKFDTLPAKGHPFVTWKVTVASTCTSEGVTAAFCDDCGLQIEGMVGTIKMKAHTPGEWQKIRLPRTYCTGLNAVLCTECDAIVQSKTLEKLDPGSPMDGIIDVYQNDWYFDTVSFVLSNNLFSGVDAANFAPKEKMTRAMFVTVLGRLHGVEVDNNVKTKFADVKKNKYYTGYIKWATDNGIVSGMSNTAFAPDADITREQICALIVRYCDYAGIELDGSTETELFRDADVISAYALDSVLLCHKAGIVTGRGNGFFAPQANATRAEVAQVFKNLCLGYLAEE